MTSGAGATVVGANVLAARLLATAVVDAVVRGRLVWLEEDVEFVEDVALAEDAGLAEVLALVLERLTMLVVGWTSSEWSGSGMYGARG